MELLARNATHPSIQTLTVNPGLTAASVPPVTYDACDRKLVPPLYSSGPCKTTFEMEISRMTDQDPDKENAGTIKASVRLTKLLELYQDKRGSTWITALEENPSLRVKGFGHLHLKNMKQDSPGGMVDWTIQTCNLQEAFHQPVTLNIQQLKAVAKLVSVFTSRMWSGGVTAQLQVGVFTGNLSTCLLLISHFPFS